MHDHPTPLLEPPQEAATTENFEGETTTTAVPLSYGQLRIIAECAAGIGNQAVQFVADSDAVTWVGNPPQPSDPANVLVPALDQGRYPAVQAVQLELSWTPPAPGTPVSGTIDAVAAGADAVFWSDSAVQKFVVPYAASCAAWDAASTLASLQNAWNLYPTSQVAQFALLHLVPPATGQVSLESSLAFAVGDLSSVQVMTMGDYAGQGLVSVLASTPQIEAVAFQQALPQDPSAYPGYEMLRGIAEWAASVGEAMYFTWSPGQEKATHPVANPTAGQFTIPACSPGVPQERPAPGAVTFIGTDGVPVSLARGDAVFWSEGSIQQFLLPYYASVRGFQAPGELQAIVDAWNVEDNEVVVDGLVHLPQSAWVEVDEEEENGFWQTLTEHERRKLEKFHVDNVVSPFSALARVGVLHRHGIRRHLLRLVDFRVLHPQFFH
ncbi:MAG TPA: hypothetical protein VHG08_05185 [Longimicrobium sp.]|nr:hypothetical protein [Longimicrobium sp.]